MIHDILESDIDLAQNLIDASVPDAQIVAALVLRRLDSAKATQLIADLRNGKAVEVDLCLLEPEAAAKMARRAMASRSGELRQSPRSAHRKSRSHRKNSPKSRNWKTPPARWIVSALVVCLVAGVCALVMAKRRFNSADARQPLKANSTPHLPVQGSAHKSAQQQP